MVLLHDVNGPCFCTRCGGQLQVKLAKTGNYPGQYYLHCVPCSYHFVFPQSEVPRSVAISQTPPLSQSSVSQASGQPRFIDCSKPGCTRRGCIQCSRQMCKQCCIGSIAQPVCSLRAHTFAQLSARQQGKLPEPSMSRAPLADDFPLDPSLWAVSFGMPYPALPPPLLPVSSEPSQLDNEDTQQYDAAISASLQPTTTALLSPSTIEEDQQQFAAAIAASLRLPNATPSSSAQASSSLPPRPHRPTPAANAGPSQPTVGVADAASVKSHPSTTPLTKVRTVPYNVKQHMSDDWMRRLEDNTKKPKRARINLDNRFSLVFWHEDGKSPKVRAIHECPVWPKWIIMDAPDICKELGIFATLVEYYDMRSCQWITCSLSYPHDVKRDGYLLLRLLETSCLGLEKYVSQATTKDAHLRNNIAGERAGVRHELEKRKKEPPPFLVDISDDDEVMIVKSPHLKRLAEDDDDINTRPSQRQRLQLAGPSHPHVLSPTLFDHHCDNPTLSPFSRSSSITTTSPCPSSPTPLPIEIHVPEGCKWPEGMYAIDMARGFHQIDQGGEGLLKARLFTIFGREIPITTYRDQCRRWKALTQSQRDQLKAFGRIPAGLWARVPKIRK
ncbi:hypothetical protein B0H34DRAFT_805105 [Crassisporium funariophilum]|nr:hypothetical protein B0H34DRAFT_805105 [Crassisporium funariophilum]